MCMLAHVRWCFLDLCDGCECYNIMWHVMLDDGNIIFMVLHMFIFICMFMMLYQWFLCAMLDGENDHDDDMFMFMWWKWQWWYVYGYVYDGMMMFMFMFVWWDDYIYLKL